jgi:hypothetical protein
MAQAFSCVMPEPGRPAGGVRDGDLAPGRPDQVDDLGHRLGELCGGTAPRCVLTAVAARCAASCQIPAQATTSSGAPSAATSVPEPRIQVPSVLAVASRLEWPPSTAEVIACAWT